jgi:hypothetical protein
MFPPAEACSFAAGSHHINLEQLSGTRAERSTANQQKR